MMIGKIYCAALVLLAGCQSAPTIVKEPVEVQVPVSVPCKIETPAAPAWALSAVPTDANVYEKVRAALAELDQRVAYEGQLLAAIAGCQ